jgi:hypothetical protein
MVTIYVLERNEIPFYIGKTKNPTLREKDHKSKYGNNISFVVIDETLDIKEIWKFWESYWIEQFKVWGFELLNKNKGGGGLVTHTDKTKLKISQNKLGKKQSNLSSLKKSNSMKNGGALKISIANTNPSIETRQKMSLAKLGKPNNNLSKAKLGKPNNNNKPIIQYDLDMNIIKEWKSASDAMKVLNNKGIPNALVGVNKTSCSSIWKYKTF